MRTDLLRHRKQDTALDRTNLDFVHLLRCWFNRGFLVLKQINWDTPARILDKIVAYEAVHEINGWDDLRRRLYPADRRCFAFFHPAMPDEPLIFVEVALTETIPSSVDAVLSEDRNPLAAEDAKVAVFYSISNCQHGLAGISFGNLLIKQVVAELALEFPQLTHFVTLSPIPGLCKWAQTQTEDTSHGHAQADSSANGMAQSGGAMVNYLYDLSRTETNHEGYALASDVTLSRAVRALTTAAFATKSKELQS